MFQLYRSIMDPETNPLRNLPPVQRFQAMTYLGMMWTTIFCVSFGAWYWLGHLVVFHTLVAAGAFVTGLTFRKAESKLGHRDHPRADGTARYDDIGGGI